MGTWRFALVLVTSLSGCSQRPGHHAPATGPSSPTVPTVSWSDDAFVTTGLPAVARNGNVIVVALRENDAGRGFPNLRLEVRGRDDSPRRSIPILNSNDYEALAPGGLATTELDRRIAAANAELEQLRAVHDLTAMTPLEVQPPDEDGDTQVATGHGLRVVWHGDRLDIATASANRRVASANGRSWLAPPHPSCASCEPCKNPAFLAAIFHAPGIHVVVAQIGYRGTDACWEPSDQFHVVAW